MGKMYLPRAITFFASLYSFGLPPEILGLNFIDEKDIRYVRDIYSNFDNDLRDYIIHLNMDNFKTLFPNVIVKAVEKASKLINFEFYRKHNKITSIILDDNKKKDYKVLTENITRSGFIRVFLG